LVPTCQITIAGRLADHVRFEARKLGWGFLPAEPTVEHVDQTVAKALPQQQFQPRRKRHQFALAGRRRRADRHDPGPALVFQASHQMRKRVLEAG
jgi:hypothetical protein